MLLAVGPLALWGAWALSVSLPAGQWLTGALSVGAEVTAVGLLFLKVWSQSLAYLFAAWRTLDEIYFGWVLCQTLRDWSYDWLTLILTLVPSAGFLMGYAGGAWIVYKQYCRQTHEV